MTLAEAGWPPDTWFAIRVCWKWISGISMQSMPVYGPMTRDAADKFLAREDVEQAYSVEVMALNDPETANTDDDEQLQVEES
jgi:hypothetical protein